MENRFKKIIEQVKKGSMEAIKQSPVELVISGFYFVISVLIINDVLEGAAWNRFIATLPISFGLCYAINTLTANKNIGLRLVYFASIALIPIFYFLNIETFSAYFNIAIIISYLSMSLARRERDDDNFVSNLIVNTGNIALASIFALLVFALLMSIHESIRFLFDVNIFSRSHSYGYFGSLSGYLIFPMLFLIFDNKRRGVLEGNSILRLLINYILTPAVLIYGAIIYIYFIKIAVQWELPHGIAAISIGFLCGALLIKMVGFLLEKPVCKWFFNYLPFWSLPALIMLWIATIYRVNQYGFTVERVYLVLAILSLTVWCLVMFIKHPRKYYTLTLSTAILFFIFTYVPYINAESIEKYSQKDRPVDPKESVLAEDYQYIRFNNSNLTVDIKGYNYLNNVSRTYNTDRLDIRKRKYDNGSSDEAGWRYCIDEKTDSLYLINMESKIVASWKRDSLVNRQLRAAGYDINSTVDYDSTQMFAPKILQYQTESMNIIFNSISVIKENGKFRIDDVEIGLVLTK